MASCSHHKCPEDDDKEEKKEEKEQQKKEKEVEEKPEEKKEEKPEAKKEEKPDEKKEEKPEEKKEGKPEGKKEEKPEEKKEEKSEEEKEEKPEQQMPPSRHLGLITEKECQTIFAQMVKFERIRGSVKSYNIRQDLNTDGYFMEFFHLFIKYQVPEESELTMKRAFMKMNPTNSRQLLDYVQKAGMMQKERFIYTKLLSELRKFTNIVFCPHCYYTRDDLIVLENIRDKGYIQLQDTRDFLHKHEIKSVLQSLAALHASSIAYEQKQKINIGEVYGHLLEECAISPKTTWYNTGKEAILACALKHPLYQSEPLQMYIKEELPTLMDGIFELIKPSKDYYNVLCHRDIWNPNLFFDKTDASIRSAVLVDFQLSRYTPPAVDVIMTMYLNTRPIYRKQVMAECIDFYYECLTNELSRNNLNISDFLNHQDYNKSLVEYSLFGAVYQCIAATIFRIPQHFLPIMKVHSPEQFYKFVCVDRTKPVVDMISMDKNYESYVADCVYDLMELVIKGRHYVPA